MSAIELQANDNTVELIFGGQPLSIDMGEKTADAARYAGLAQQAAVDAEESALSVNTEKDWPFDTRRREPWGIARTIAAIKLSNSEADWYGGGRFRIGNVSGNDLITVISDSLASGKGVFKGGETVLVTIETEPDSLNLSQTSASVGSATLPQVVTFAQIHPGKYEAEITIPTDYSGVTAVARKDAAFATEYLPGTLNYYVKQPGASVANPDLGDASLLAMIANDFAPASGNQWPRIKRSLFIGAGDGAESLNVFNYSIAPGGKKWMVIHATWPDGSPAIFDNATIQFKAVGSSVLVTVPVSGAPGVYAGWIHARAGSGTTGLAGPANNLTITFDNQHTFGTYTGQDVLVEEIQMYDAPPSYYPDPATADYPDDEILFDHYGSTTSLLSPRFEGRGTDYMGTRFTDYLVSEEAANPIGSGSQFSRNFLAERTGELAYAPGWEVHDNGQTSLALKASEWVSGGNPIHQAGKVHGGERERVASVISIKDINNLTRTVPVDSRRLERIRSYTRTDKTTLHDFNDNNLDAAEIDRISHFEANYLELYWKVKFLRSYTMQTLYMMWSASSVLDNVPANGEGWNKITMPDQGGAEYVAGATFNAAYPNESRLIYHAPDGRRALVENILGKEDARFKSGVVIAGNALKFYSSVIGIHDGGMPNPSPVSVSANDVFEMKMRITFYQDNE